MKFDSIIIGSGISGLTSALVLAQQGFRVAVLEQNEKLAPLMSRFPRDGVWFDSGFHYTSGFGPSESLTVLLHYLKIRELINPIPLNPNGYDVIVIDDKREIRIPNGFERVREVFCRHFPKSHRAIDAYIERIKYIIDNTPFVSFNVSSDNLHKKNFTIESLEELL